MSFFGSIFGGQNNTLNKAIPQAGQVAGYGIGLGENLSTQAGGWFSDILSGDPTKQMQALAPEISATQTRASQAKKELGEFGTRSGGTASAASNIDASTRGNITNMIASLTSGAAAGAAGLGQSLLSTGMQALNQQVSFSQQQMENWANSILGQGTGFAAGAGEALALGKIPGLSAAPTG